mgnify:CR=1 FL=1
MWPTAKLSTQQYRLVQKAHHAKPLLRCTIKFKEMNQQPIKSMYIILQSIIAGQNLSHLTNSECSCTTSIQIANKTWQIILQGHFFTWAQLQSLHSCWVIFSGKSCFSITLLDGVHSYCSWTMLLNYLNRIYLYLISIYK